MKKTAYIGLNLMIGAFIGAVAVNSLVIPNDFMTGGLGGLALLARNLTGISMQIYLIVFYIPIGIWAYFKYGIPQLLSATFCYLSFTVFLWVTPLLFPPLVTDPMLASFAAGALFGISGGVVLRLNVSNGPESLIGMHLKQRYNLQIGAFMTIFNAVVIIASIFTSDLITAMYSTIMIYISGRVTDFIILGFNRFYDVSIISDQYLEITEYIHKNIKRGVTYVPCMGTYELKKKMMLKTLVKNEELIRIKEYIRVNAPDSFLFVNQSTDVIGKSIE